MHSPAHSSSEEFADISMEIESLKESLQIIGETPVKTQELLRKRYNKNMNGLQVNSIYYFLNI